MNGVAEGQARSPRSPISSAGRTVGLLGAIFTYATRQGLFADIPAHGVVKFAEGRRQRRLTDDEYRMLGMALSNAAQEGSGSPP
jgi:hypothetical protein